MTASDTARLMTLPALVLHPVTAAAIAHGITEYAGLGDIDFTCRTCGGEGRRSHMVDLGDTEGSEWVRQFERGFCPDCDGTGRVVPEAGTYVLATTTAADPMEVALDQYRSDSEFVVTDKLFKNGKLQTVVKRDGKRWAEYTRRPEHPSSVLGTVPVASADPGTIAGTMSSVSPSTRRAVYERDSNACQARSILGKPCVGELTVHHLLPSQDGGGNEHSNLLTVCRGHHDTIHSVPRPHGRSRADHASYQAAHLANMRRLGLLREPVPGHLPKMVKFAPKPSRGLGPVVPYRSTTPADAYANDPTPRRRRRKPPPPPMEWVDPDTGQMYLLTARGATPVEASRVEIDEAV